MPPLTIGLTFASARRKTSVAFLSLGLVWLLAQPAQAQQQPGPLSFFKNYFITGDYAVGGASLWRQGSVDGKAVVQISVTGVPEGADILAAYLYVQTAETAQWSGIDHATFNGSDLGPGSNSLAKALNWDLATTPCWTVAYPGGRRLVTYRADVLRFLPIGPYGKLASPSDGPHMPLSRCRIPERRSVTLKRAAPRAVAGLGRARSAQVWSWSTGTRRCLSRRSSSTTAAPRRRPSQRWTRPLPGSIRPRTIR